MPDQFVHQLWHSELQRALLVEGDHWDAGMDGAEDFRLRRCIQAVRELGEPLVQPFPERDPILDRWRHFDRAELAMCSCRTLPSTRRVSTRLTCRPVLFWRNRTNM